MKKKMLSITMAAVLAVSLTACGGNSSESEAKAPAESAVEKGAEGEGTEAAKAPAKGTYTLNIGSALSATHPTSIAFQSFKEAVEEKTNGELVVNIYTDSALGSESDLLEQVTSGTVEGMLQGGAANWEPYNAEVNVALLPFLFTSLDNARAAWGGQFGQEFCEKLLEPTGVTVLSVWEQGYRHMTNNTKPIVEPSDVAGIKFRTNENSMKVAMYEAAGGSAVIMSFSDVYTGLQNKTIDGQENPLATIYTSSLQDVQKYLSLTGHMYDAAPLAVNTAWFESLPEEYQTILKEEAVNAREIVLEENDENKYLELLKEAGMEVNDVNKEAFQEAMKPVWDKYAADFENGQYWIDLATSFNK
jgi:tripartite ATP-independent transporter DctP family solute receptor